MKRYKTANGICFFSLLFLLVFLWLKEGSPWQGTYWADLVYFMAQSCCIGCASRFHCRRGTLSETFSSYQAARSSQPGSDYSKSGRNESEPFEPEEFAGKDIPSFLDGSMSSMAYQSQRIYFSNIGSEGSHLCSGISV